MQLTFALPTRDVKEIAELRGTMDALLPGRIEEFRFPNLRQVRNQAEERAGVVVTLVGCGQNGGIWEVHMKLRIDKPADALASHRDWVLQNTTYLTNDAGEIIEDVGFETTLQSEQEVGIAYLFEVPGNIDDYEWVYRSPVAIVRTPVEYKLTDVPLP